MGRKRTFHDLRVRRETKFEPFVRLEPDELEG